MIGRVGETSASFEARSAPRLYPTERLGVKFPGPTRHFRQIDPLPTLSACPLRSDRVRTFAPQRIDAVCQQRTNAMQQRLFDHLVGTGEQRDGWIEAQCFGSPEIDDKLEFRSLLDRQITGPFPLEDAIDIRRGASVEIDEFNTV